MVKLSIEVDIYNMHDGKLVDFLYDGKLYQEVQEVIHQTGVIKAEPDPIVSEIKQKFTKKAPKRYLNMIDKWIRDKHIGSFTEDDFFRDHTNMKAMWHRSRFKDYVTKMIIDGTVIQWPDSKHFKVVNNKNAKM
jgi:hypothetical protein